MRKNKIFKFVITFFISFFIMGFILLIIIFHSPYTDMRDLWVTTAMSTMSHQYLAKVFVSDKDIKDIMAKNTVLQPSEGIDLSLIDTLKSGETNVLKSSDLSNEIEKIDITGTGFKGKLLIVHDPSKVFVGVADTATSKGAFLKDMVSKYNAAAGMNAGGFADINSKHGTNRTADGLLISEGVVLNGVEKVKYGLIGFTTDDKLMLGSYTLSEIKNLHIRDAVSFLPPLIVNGQPCTILGNGGWGMNPRSAIGQRKDGSVLLLVIDGRQTSSSGVSIKQVQDLMLSYNAYNATNLDGGSSTIMVYNNEIINKPCSVATGRFLPDAFIVKK